MMLDRLRIDCDYYLGYGNKCDKYLWAGSVDGQIAEMRRLYDIVPEKPVWLTAEDIDEYERMMKEEDQCQRLQSL